MDLLDKIQSLVPVKGALIQNLIGIEKESLRVSEDGSISQEPHPEAYGSPLTNPAITTDFSEALIELVTEPFDSADKALNELAKIQHFVHHHLTPGERFWPASMPCILRGHTNIPIAQYGSSNLGIMKTVYRRGLANRYGSVMQAISGIHFNYSFSLDFLQAYRDLMSPDMSLRSFIDYHYMGLARNVMRYGWIIPYLFGASASVCKSFMKDYHEHDLEEFDDNTFYLPYATSLRMGDIGYQNSQEEEKGVKANYNSLHNYVHSLRAAMQTSCKDFEEIGLKKDGEYQQLNTNILQIANEYYASVRPKPLLHGMDRPLRALTNNGIGYIEIRSLDVNPLISLGIDKPQIHFLEAFLLFCLLQDSAAISTSEQFNIDNNDNLVAHKGRKPGLKLTNNGMEILLQDWGKEIFSGITDCSKLLTKEHQKSVQKMLIRIHNPDLTPSAIMLKEMQQKESGFFEYIDKFSYQNRELYRSKSIDKDYFVALDELAISSHKEQLKLEAEDVLSFDKFIEKYFAGDA